MNGCKNFMNQYDNKCGDMIKCVNLTRVLIQGSKVILFVTRECLARASLDAGGAPPRTDALIGPAAFGDVQTGQLKRRGASACSLSSLLQLSGAPELVTARSNARKADLEAGPLDSHNETNHRRGSKTVPKP